MNYDSLLIGKWELIDDSRNLEYKNKLEYEFKSNGEWIVYTDGEIQYTFTWKTDNIKFKKSIFLLSGIMDDGLNISPTAILKINENEMIQMDCECGIPKHFRKRHSYILKYKKVK